MLNSRALLLDSSLLIRRPVEVQIITFDLDYVVANILLADYKPGGACESSNEIIMNHTVRHLIFS